MTSTGHFQDTLYTCFNTSENSNKKFHALPLLLLKKGSGYGTDIFPEKIFHLVYLPGKSATVYNYDDYN